MSTNPPSQSSNYQQRTQRLTHLIQLQEVATGPTTPGTDLTAPGAATDPPADPSTAAAADAAAVINPAVVGVEGSSEVGYVGLCVGVESGRVESNGEIPTVVALAPAVEPQAETIQHANSFTHTHTHVLQPRLLGGALFVPGAGGVPHHSVRGIDWGHRLLPPPLRQPLIVQVAHGAFVRRFVRLFVRPGYAYVHTHVCPV